MSPKVFLPALLIGIYPMTATLTAQSPIVEILYPPGGSLLDRLCKSDLNLPIDERALQAAVKVIDHDYRYGPDPAYKRAWAIVNDAEGYKPFLDELKALRKDLK